MHEYKANNINNILNFIRTTLLYSNPCTYNNLLYRKLLSPNLSFIIITSKGDDGMARLHMRITELLKEKNISKNRICKDLDLGRGNFNKYCRDQFQRIDARLILRLCEYFDCAIEDLLVIMKEEDE